jgi:hypothetical protein
MGIGSSTHPRAQDAEPGALYVLGCASRGEE